MFVVCDLKAFTNSIEKLGFNINQGVEKGSGQISSVASQTACLYTGFRKSLYNHNVYHSSDYLLIPKNRFSYNNIHINLGNRRYFSTTVYKKKEYKKIWK